MEIGKQTSSLHQRSCSARWLSDRTQLHSHGKQDQAHQPPEPDRAGHDRSHLVHLSQGHSQPARCRRGDAGKSSAFPGCSTPRWFPNVKGCERAIACKVDEINLVMSASETHNRANLRMSCEQSLAQFAEIVKLAQGAPVSINASLSTSFGCPFDGVIPPERVTAPGAAPARSRHPVRSPSATPPAWPIRRRCARLCETMQGALAHGEVHHALP